MKLLITLAFLLNILFISCKTEKKGDVLQDDHIPVTVLNTNVVIAETPFDSFNRDQIKAELHNKILRKEPLIVHVFVPLCDNDNQGIVPVSKSLGDGKNVKTNLYWGAGYGVKTHFKKSGWNVISEMNNLSEDVLERIIFEKNIAPSVNVIVIADAYAGDKMQTCLEGFFNNLAETLNDSVKINDSLSIDLNNADLVAFTGHNGLMDNGVSETINKNAKPKDAVVIACISHPYFIERLNHLHAYPLITTNSLMAPEAYVLDAIINSWANMEEENFIFLSAANAYSKYQKCSLTSAKHIFKTGW